MARLLPVLLLLLPVSASAIESLHHGASGPDIFGSVALKAPQAPLEQRWERFSGQRLDPARDPWRGVVEAAKALTPEQALERINSWVNGRLTYTSDEKVYGQEDRWAGAEESLRRGRGDCEDFALTKLQLLKAAGFPASDLYLSVVFDQVRRAEHAVVVARVGGGYRALDLGTDRVLDAGKRLDFRPIFTYGAGGPWTHGYRQEPQDPGAGLIPR
jgi:predicted transglutaminase-like cysteine proteinase